MISFGVDFFTSSLCAGAHTVDMKRGKSGRPTGRPDCPSAIFTLAIHVRGAHCRDEKGHVGAVREPPQPSGRSF